MWINFHGLSRSYCSGKISSLGCYIERLRCCCWNEYTKQCLLWLLRFFPIFESCSHSQNISILYYKKGQSSRNCFTYQKKEKKTTLCAIILSFLSKVGYYLPAKIIACKMSQENMKILFGQPNICHLKSIIFTSGRQRLKASQLSRIFSLLWFLQWDFYWLWLNNGSPYCD